MNLKVFGTRKREASSGTGQAKQQFLPPHITPPPSKSHSIRFLLLASLAGGESRIDNILISDDISSAYGCLQAFGVRFEHEMCDEARANVRVMPPTLGLFHYAINRQEVCFDVGNSGTLLYMLSMLVASIPATFHIKGDASIKKRPLAPILEALNELGVSYILPQSKKASSLIYDNEKAPPCDAIRCEAATCDADSYDVITIYGRRIEKEGSIHLEGKFSQVVSGLLIASVLWDAKVHISLEVAGEAPYIMMSLQHLKKRGIHIEVNESLTQYECSGNKAFRSSPKRDIYENACLEHHYIESFYEIVPNDWSQSAFLALASITSASPLLISPLFHDAVQADSTLVEYLQRLGCAVCIEDSGFRLEGESTLHSASFNLANTPDSLPYLAALCSIAKGVSRLEGVEICRFKECDRVHAMCVELGKLGVNITEEQDRLIIEGAAQLKSGVRLCTYGDHRIAMSLLSLCLSLKKDEWCIVENVECCKISYPSFLNFFPSYLV